MRYSSLTQNKELIFMERSAYPAPPNPSAIPDSSPNFIPANGLSASKTSYIMGDIDFSGTVDAGDISLVLGSLGTGTTTNAGFLIGEAFGATTGPDPSTATLTSNAVHINELAVTGISAPADAGSGGGGHLAYTVTFNKSVTAGLDTSDFLLRTTGTVTGQSVLSVSGSGTSYTVTVDPGTGWGTLELDVLDDDTIHDAAANKLGGTGEGNGVFFGAELEPTVTFSGATSGGEGDTISLSLGTDHYTLPSGTTWQVAWGDGVVDPLSGSAPTATHEYTSGAGLYYPVVVATDPDGQVFTTDVAPVSLTPNAPTGAAVTNNGDGTATLTWDSPSALSTWYTIMVSIDGGDFQLYADGISPADESIEIFGITPGHSYQFKLGSNNNVSAAWAVLGDNRRKQRADDCFGIRAELEGERCGDVSDNRRPGRNR